MPNAPAAVKALVHKDAKIDDVLAHKGLIEIRDELISELHEIKEELENLTNKQSEYKKFVNVLNIKQIKEMISSNG